MKTDDFIRALAADNVQPRTGPASGLLAALVAGFVVSFVMFMLLLGPRPDIAIAATHPRFLLKFVVTLSLAGAAAVLSLRLVRPGARTWPAAAGLVVAPVLVAAGVLSELVLVPSAQWEPRLVGNNAAVCLTFIPLLSLPLLPAALIALRAGAPTRTTLTGAVAGLLASGLAATLYAAHCIDDSPLFVATWYTIAVAIVVTVGAVVGRRALHW